MPTKTHHAWESRLGKAPNRSDVIRSIVLEHIRYFEARPVPVIHEYVLNDYGTVTDRTIYRHLRKLLDDGAIKRVQDDSEDTWGYVRANKPSWNRDQQVYV